MSREGSADFSSSVAALSILIISAAYTIARGRRDEATGLRTYPGPLAETGGVMTRHVQAALLIGMSIICVAVGYAIVIGIHYLAGD